MQGRSLAESLGRFKKIECSLYVSRRTMEFRRSERARNEGTTGPKRLDDTRCTTYQRPPKPPPRVTASSPALHRSSFQSLSTKSSGSSIRVQTGKHNKTLRWSHVPHCRTNSFKRVLFCSPVWTRVGHRFSSR